MLTLAIAPQDSGRAKKGLQVAVGRTYNSFVGRHSHYNASVNRCKAPEAFPIPVGHYGYTISAEGYFDGGVISGAQWVGLWMSP